MARTGKARLGKRLSLAVGIAAALSVVAAPAAQAHESYQIKRGDTLSKIAAAQGTTVASLAARNGIADPNFIIAGTTLRLGGPAVAAASTTSSSDTSSSSPETTVSSSYGGSVEGIIRAAAERHGLDGDYLVSVAECESSLNPQAVNPSGYYGLFQFDQATWGEYGSGSIYDASAQAEAAASLIAAGQGSRWPVCGG
ncbi:hypothetical protein BH18ACT15_BH18ACT15_09980 [soil metagenome]